MTQLPARARVVVVGGGIAGASVAYHLTKLGYRDLLLLEQAKFAGGTTWHSAGQVGRLRTSSAMTRINQASAKLYKSLQEETGKPTGWVQTGSLMLARTKQRVQQYRRSVAMAEVLGVECEWVSPSRVRELWPLLRTSDLVGSLYVPHDGIVDPTACTLALLAGATSRGCTAIENIAVQKLLVAKGRVAGVRTSQGDVEAEIVVLTGGMWSRELAHEIGVNIPLAPVEHHYVVSHSTGRETTHFPCGRDPDAAIYFRGSGQQIIVGAFQTVSKPWNVDRVPSNFSFQLLPPDWQHFAAPLAEGEHRIHGLKEIGIERFVNGPESFTPDNQFLLGETPELRNLFVATGFNSAGIACAGGAGEALAQWIEGGEQPYDLWSVDIRRFAPWHNQKKFLRERVSEGLGLHYRMAWPNLEFSSGRNLRRSPLHGSNEKLGAYFGQKMGIERPLYFARTQLQSSMQYSFDRQNWHDCSAHEHHAVRKSVGIFDQSSLTRLRISGPDALALLNRLCAANIDTAVGRIVYTPMLNQRGGCESDVIVVRDDADTFYLVTSSTQAIRDVDWIERNRRNDEQVEIEDISVATAVIGVMGPRSRELLALLSDADLQSTHFPYNTSRTIDVGLARVRAMRMTYVGELGYELHLRADQAAQLYDELLSAGQSLGARPAGYYAMNSLRLEKAYRAWGSDLSVDDTPLEAGLGFTIDWNKPAGFLGKEALLQQRSTGLRKRLVQIVLHDSRAQLWGGERIFRGESCIGYTSSAAYGHTFGASVALGYLKSNSDILSNAWIEAGRYQVELDGELFAARVSLRPLYDPTSTRIMA